jgi:CheY-like chemotaxis protein
VQKLPHRILVVDDDVVIRSMVAEALEFEGYEVSRASDGSEALRITDRWRPDVIVLDLMMPGMDGWTFREEQRKRPRIANIPVVILSANRMLKERTVSLDPALVIAKPFDLGSFLDDIERVLAKPQRSAT